MRFGSFDDEDDDEHNGVGLVKKPKKYVKYGELLYGKAGFDNVYNAEGNIELSCLITCRWWVHGCHTECNTN